MGAIVSSVVLASTAMAAMASSARLARGIDRHFPGHHLQLRYVDDLHQGPHQGGVQRHQYHRGHAVARLESHMVGDFGVNGDGPVGQPVPSSYLADFHKVKDISPDYFTLEKLVSLRPDFLFAGWNYGLQVGSNLTPTNLAKYHINTLALTESCAHVQSEHAVGQRRRHLHRPDRPGRDLRRRGQGQRTDCVDEGSGQPPRKPR